MKITEKRTNRGYLFRACHSKGVSHHPVIGRDSEAGRVVERLYREKKKRKKKKVSAVLWWAVVGMRKLEAGHLR